MYTLEVLNPEGVNEAKEQDARLAVRPPSLDGLRAGLVWNGKRGGREALAKVSELLRERYRDVTLSLYDGGQPCRQELLQRAVRECDVFIGSTGD
jgi:uracil-DNA glycosylase